MDTLQQQEFAQFVGERQSELLRVAYLLTGDTGHAEDLVQQAFERTAREWTSLRNPMAFARQALSRLSIDRWRALRSRAQEVSLEQLPHAPTFQDPAEAVAVRQALWDQVRRLPPRQRAVVVLRYYCDLSEQQVADELDVSLGTVKNTGAKAIAKLRKTVDNL